MSRLCRLRNKTHGEDGLWAYNEITQLRAERDNYASTGQRLALELECLLLDSKDTAMISKWWDSAHEALEQWRELVAVEQ